MTERFKTIDYYDDNEKRMRKALAGASSSVDRVKLGTSPTTPWGGVARVAGTIERQIRAANDEKVAKERSKMRSALLRAYMAPKKVFDPTTFDASEVQASILDDEVVEETDEQMMRIPPAEAVALKSEEKSFDRENPYGMEAALKVQSQYAPPESGLFGPGAGAYAGMGDNPIDELSVMDYKKRLTGEERERSLAETIAAEDRKQVNTMALEAYKRENGGSDPTSNMRDFKELQRLQTKYPPDQDGNESPQVKTFRDFVSRTKLMDLGDRFQPYDVGRGQPAAIGTPPIVTIQNGQVIRVPGAPAASSSGAPAASSSGAPPASSSGAPSTNASGVTTTELPQSRKEREKEKGRVRQTRRAGTTVIQDLQRGLDIVQNDWSHLSSATAGVAKNIPLTDAKTLYGYIQSALSNVGLDTLQTMRENSPTGGALGQVPVQQQRRLEQVLGSLDIEQRPEIIEDNLKRIINIYKDIAYGTPDEINNLLEQNKISSEIAKGAIERYDLSFDEFGRARGGNASPVSDAAPSEEDILFTMETHKMTRKQVLQKLGLR